jgi:rhodanese-related sulfurtransferase
MGRPPVPTSVKDLLAAANAVVPKLGHDEARALLGRDDVVVLDVRDAPELTANGKIPGAVHASRGMLEFKADPTSPYHDRALDPAKTILVYCASGGRSALAGKTLLEMGYRDVRNIGGFKDWLEAGGPSESV